MATSLGGFALFEGDGTPTPAASAAVRPVARIAHAHARGCSDFCFVGPSGLLVATVGNDNVDSAMHVPHTGHSVNGSVMSCGLLDWIAICSIGRRCFSSIWL